MSKQSKVHQAISNKYVGFYVACLAVYIALTALTPIRENAYDLSTLSVRLIQVSFIIPIALIWLAITYGALKFRQYAQIVRTSSDGPAYMAMATALTIMMGGLLLTSLLGLIKGFLDGPDDIRIFTIIRNALAVIVQVVIFWAMYQASEKLLLSAGATAVSTSKLRQFRLVGNLALGIGIVLYTTLMLSNEFRSSTPDYKTITSFYLNDFQLVFAVIIPYAIAWTFGINALHNIRAYLDNVKGVIYREIFGRVAAGLTIIIIFNVLLGMLSSLGGLFQNASLQAILISIYVILICYGVGYLVMASGAKRLAKLEEV